MAGLYAMLDTGLQYGALAHYGIFGVLLSSSCYSLTTVLIKKIDADIDTYASVTGTLLIAAAFLSIIWIISDNNLPTEIPDRAGLSILYLAIVGSVIGFLLFYYILKRVEATRTSLITLFTPICALLLGHLSNDEPLNWEIIIGSSFILLSLLLFEFECAIRNTRIIRRIP